MALDKAVVGRPYVADLELSTLVSGLRRVNLTEIDVRLDLIEVLIRIYSIFSNISPLFDWT